MDGVGERENVLCIPLRDPFTSYVSARPRCGSQAREGRTIPEAVKAGFHLAQAVQVSPEVVLPSRLSLSLTIQCRMTIRYPFPILAGNATLDLSSSRLALVPLSRSHGAR